MVKQMSLHVWLDLALTEINDAALAPYLVVALSFLKSI